jgi:hypothetical protein
MANWGTCFSGSNNIHFDFPPIMEDGRTYSSWQPEAVINERIQKQEDIKSNWEYRNFLTNNALQIMKYNSMESCYVLGLPCNVQTDKTPSDNVPYEFKSTFDNSTPGFGYQNSDLKRLYLTREQLNARLISPTFSIPVNINNT